MLPTRNPSSPLSMKMSRQEFAKVVINKFVRKLQEIKDQEGVKYNDPIFLNTRARCA